jgi:hypothetical protein
VKGSTVLVVGVAGMVAVAAIASGLKSAVGGSGSDDGTTAATATATAAAGPATTALPIGDVRRLPPLSAGEYEGRLVLYDGAECRPVIVELVHLETTAPSNMSAACSVWVSPGRQKLATILPPPQEHDVMTATAIVGPPEPSGVEYDPSNTGALTVTDDGAVATCDGSSVVLGRDGAARTVRTFTPLDNGFDERCVTGAIGTAVVRLADDRRRLVDVVTGRVVRRLATPARQRIIAIASSIDGLVLIADTEDGTPAGTVYGRDGRVRIPRQPIGRGVTVRKVVLAKGAAAVALQSSRGWDITSLTNGHTLISPGGARVTDVAFSPEATAVAETTDAGVVFADLPELKPRVFLDTPAHAVAWFPPR